MAIKHKRIFQFTKSLATLPQLIRFQENQVLDKLSLVFALLLATAEINSKAF
jgi:hypothetical protein